MPKIDKIDLENISLLKKEFKLKNLYKIKIKKGNYEIEISSINELSTSKNTHLHREVEKKISNKEEIKKNIKNENIIKSPMVGVAYLSVDPSSKAFVKIGQHVKKGETLLLIEAMKTFNEIKAPISGTIKEVIVLNSQPVEFGEDLVIFE